MSIDSDRSRAFDFGLRTRIVFGPGTIDQLGPLVAEQGGRRVLLVTDPGIVRAGHADRAKQSLKAAGLTVSVFDRVVENPTERVVSECVSTARAERVDFLVGLGGGSSMDTAKGCNFVLTGGGRMQDYWGVGKATRPMLPMIAIPTTAGTGSECQSFALISQDDTHVKMACGDSKAAARVAILDPQLTLTQPRWVAACTGMDALTHAVESAVSGRSTPLSRVFSREAFRLCSAGLAGVFSDGDDLKARGDLLLGAALGGAAIENSMLGAAHAAANPLTARFGLIHGRAVGLMLPAVVRYNGEDPAARNEYRALAVSSGLAPKDADAQSTVETLALHVERCRDTLELPRSLAEANVLDPDVESLAQGASVQWTASFNPRPVSIDDFVHLYRSVLGT